MGKLINGEWVEQSIVTSDQKGTYQREKRGFRSFISKSSTKFNPESNRYHLYVSYACPWAHRTLIYRKLKKLEDHISVNVVHPDMLNQGWSFNAQFDGATGDELYGLNYLYEIYQKADSQVTTSVTVPVLWDKKLKTIVNNESSEIIRMFNTEFNELTGDETDYYPQALQNEIDRWNDQIYVHVNNGVYRAGFAKTQEAYDEAVDQLFTTLDQVEEQLSQNRFLLGEQLTEADLRLIPTLLRFDIVYVTHFKCNLRRMIDYRHISRYINELYNLEAVKSTTQFDHIKRHYYYSHQTINPYQIIPKGPLQIIKEET